jgi:hypothetical protein
VGGWLAGWQEVFAFWGATNRYGRFIRPSSLVCRKRKLSVNYIRLFFLEFERGVSLADRLLHFPGASIILGGRVFDFDLLAEVWSEASLLVSIVISPIWIIIDLSTQHNTKQSLFAVFHRKSADLSGWSWILRCAGADLGGNTSISPPVGSSGGSAATSRPVAGGKLSPLTTNHLLFLLLGDVEVANTILKAAD